MKDQGTKIMETLIKLWYQQNGIKAEVEVTRNDQKTA